MRLYRFTDNTCEKLEPVTLDELDLTRQTLFIFPGMEVEKPSQVGDPSHWRDYHMDPKYASLSARSMITHLPDIHLPGDERPSKATNASKEKHLARLLERGVVLGEKCGVDPRQIVVAGYDDRDDNAIELKYLFQNPDHCGREAGEFIDEMCYKNQKQNPYRESRPLDPTKITFLGWSYGSSFIQQCGNQLNSLVKRDVRQKIHAVTVSSIMNMEWLVGKGFPGLYMYGLNDDDLTKYASSYQSDLMNMVRLAQGSAPLNAKIIPPDEVPALIPQQRTDQVITISNMPDKVNRYRVKPRHAKNPRPVQQEHFPNPHHHAPAAFMEAMPGSTFMDSKGRTHEAWRHTRIFQNAMEEILTRGKYCVTAAEMLGIPGLMSDEAHNLMSDKGVHVATLDIGNSNRCGSAPAMALGDWVTVTRKGSDYGPDID